MFQSIATDAALLLEQPDSNSAAGPAFISDCSEKIKSKSVFTTEFGFGVIDEAHNGRKPNKLHAGYKMIAQNTHFLMFMTATPAVTTPLVRPLLHSSAHLCTSTIAIAGSGIHCTTHGARQGFSEDQNKHERHSKPSCSSEKGRS